MKDLIEYLLRVCQKDEESNENKSTTEEFLGEVEFPKSPIPSGYNQRIDEIKVKGGGRIWRIHRNDPDPFPSNPHAHNVESGLKLDLSNGRLFFKGKDTDKSISQKDLLFIRSEMEKKGIKPPERAV